MLMNGPVKVLVIDDSLDDREAVVRMLRESPFEAARIFEAESGEAALASLCVEPVDCILLDFSMPGSDGLIVLRELALRFPDIPVVMMTGEGNERIAVEALKGGAQDYVLKSDTSGVSLAKAIDKALACKAQEAEIIRRANYDELTGLSNRRMFLDRLDHALCRTGASTVLAVVLFDLNGFKPINDLHGHAVGDKVLREVALRSKQALRSGDTVARLGGDEFIVLLESVQGDGREVVTAVCRRLESCIATDPFHIDGLDIRISASFGAALYPHSAMTRAELIRIADKNMYLVKHGQLAGPFDDTPTVGHFASGVRVIS
jgi:diguanylate cyclase (GGDEF)-like protein